MRYAYDVLTVLFLFHRVTGSEVATAVCREEEEVAMEAMETWLR